MKKILLFTLCFILLTGCGDVKLANGEKAVVSFSNNDGISSDELYKELKKNYAAESLINMIDTYLLAKEYKVSTDEKNYISEIIESVKDYAKENNMEYMDYISQSYGIYSESEFKDYIALNYKRNLWIKDWNKTQVSDKEIEEYYKNVTVGDVEASHILISNKATDDMTDDEKERLEKEALETAKSIIKKLDKGEDFATLAKQYSDDEGSASEGGSLGYFNRGKMKESFEEAAINLEVGKYSKTPVKTSYGYHIIYKTDQKEKPALLDVKSDIIESISKELLNTDSTIPARALIALRDKYNMKIKDSELKAKYDKLMSQ